MDRPPEDCLLASAGLLARPEADTEAARAAAEEADPGATLAQLRSIVRVFLADPTAWATPAELARETGIDRRILCHRLGKLVDAQILQVSENGTLALHVAPPPAPLPDEDPRPAEQGQAGLFGPVQEGETDEQILARRPDVLAPPRNYTAASSEAAEELPANVTQTQIRTVLAICRRAGQEGTTREAIEEETGFDPRVVAARLYALGIAEPPIVYKLAGVYRRSRHDRRIEVLVHAVHLAGRPSGVFGRKGAAASGPSSAAAAEAAASLLVDNRRLEAERLRLSLEIQEKDRQIERLRRLRSGEEQDDADTLARLMRTIGNPGRCESCSAEVVWITTRKNGKAAPFDPGGKSHFATCPNANRHRKR